MNLNKTNNIIEFEINQEDIKDPYFTLGEIARELNYYFFISNNREEKYNIIIKNIPVFINWIIKSRTNFEYLLKLYQFLDKRFKVYLPQKKIRNIKNILNNYNRNRIDLDNDKILYYKKILKLYQRINKKFKKLKVFFDKKENYREIKYSSLADLYFLQGFDNFSLKGEDTFLNKWIEGTILNDNISYKIAFILGRYYYRVAENEIKLVKNLGLSKKIVSWLKKIQIENFITLFREITISYFHLLRKRQDLNNPKESEKSNPLKLDHLIRYRRIIEKLLDVFYFESETTINNNNINNKMIQFCFMSGFLVRNSPIKKSMSTYKKLNFPQKNEYTKLLYDLGKMVRMISEYELEEFQSHSFKNIIKKFQDLNHSNILYILLHVSKILIRNWLKNVQNILGKGTNDDLIKIKYIYTKRYHDIIYRFLHLDQNKKFDKYAGPIVFMIGFSSIPIKSNQNSKKVKK